VELSRLPKAKAKSGTGQGTGKKGWNRWQKSANKAKSAKPYTSKGVKHGSNKQAAGVGQAEKE